MKKGFGIFLSACLVCGYGIYQAKAGYAEPDRIPYTAYYDFETGELNGWECYPYAQDIGWDPRTVCKTEPSHEGSKFSLTRMVEPNQVAGLEEGFTKQLDMWTSTGSRMQYMLFLTADRRPEKLETSICLFDGRRFFKNISAPEVNKWIKLDFPLREFTFSGKPLETGRHIQAVTIKATYPEVSDFISYTINLDNFALSGERQRRFLAVDPPSTTFEMFNSSILHKHFFYGDILSMSVKPENAAGKAQVGSVECALLDPSGKEVVSGFKLKAASNGIWTAENIHAFSKNDPRGQWRLAFSGKTPGGEVQWSFGFIMPGNRLTPKEHPRLFFTSEELKKRLADQSPEEKKILDSALSRPDYFKKVDVASIEEYKEKFFSGFSAGGPYGIDEGQNWRNPMQRLSMIIEAGAWRYAFTGDQLAGQKGREALLKLSSFKFWTGAGWLRIGNHVHYPLGWISNSAGIGFDLLYPLLSEPEKKTVREAIVDKGLKPLYRNLVEMDRMPSNLTNHIAVLVYGTVIAGTAIYGEDQSNPTVEPYLSGVLTKMKTYMDRTYYADGGYGEPTTYQDMATRDLVTALDALERNFGIDYTNGTCMKDTYLYPLYATYTNGLMPDFGDSAPRYNLSGNTYSWLSYRNQNPWTYSFVQKSAEQGRGDVFSYLWYTKGVTPRSRTELTPSHLFPVKGDMVMRSDWTDRGSILVFKCGPNSNHYHYDQGTFSLFTNGEELLSEAGHGSSYYANLYYPCYYIQPIGHNTMLIDNNAESQWPADYENGVAALRNYPKILHSFAGWNADETEGDLTCVYKGEVTAYTRSLLFMKPDILFLYDKVKSPQEHSYSWIFHAEHTNGKSSMTYTGGHLRINRNKASLDMDVLSPQLASGRIRNSDRDESFITLSSGEGIKDTDFLAVLRPNAVGGSSEPVRKMESTLLKPSGWIGARVTADDGVTMALFRSGAPLGTAAVEGFTTDAERFTVSIDKQGRVNRFFLRGSVLGKGSATLFQTNKPIAVSVSYLNEGCDLEVDTASDTEIQLTLEKDPGVVTLNGKITDEYKFGQATKQFVIKVLSGHAVVAIR
jgi:hypothetical protein